MLAQILRVWGEQRQRWPRPGQDVRICGYLPTPFSTVSCLDVAQRPGLIPVLLGPWLEAVSGIHAINSAQVGGCSQPEP